MKLAGWGRYPVVEANLVAPRTLEGLIKLVEAGTAIARGNGRAYGDSAISASNTIHMKHFNRMLEFDSVSGQLIAESGVLLADIIHIFLPRGWFPRVIPGTKFVTLGGMIAADIHGKNHHKDGSFRNFVDWIEIIDTTGKVTRCSTSINSELFEWTVGGMGLTGIILRAAIRLQPVETAWIKQKTLVAENIDSAIDIFEASMDSTYSVAWIDCLQRGAALGRSLIVCGEHAKLMNLGNEKCNQPLKSKDISKRSVPVNFPCWALNRWSVRAFNALYYWNGKRQPKEKIVSWDSFFFPLDAILGWNKIYGRKGFVQFQCVIPLVKSRQGIRALLLAISEARVGSFLAVLKRFGAQDSRFSFPMKGYTLALDFPRNKRTLELMNQLDTITLAYSGRFYLAKDSRMSAETFINSDERVELFKVWREKQKVTRKFCSNQAVRLEL